MFYTLITGASHGLGLEMANKCASLGRNVLLVALPNESVNEIAGKIASKYQVASDFYECDLTQLNAAKSIWEWSEVNNYQVNFLINNAGFGGIGEFESYSLEYINSMLDLNVRAVTLLAHYFTPELKKNAPAHVLNVASMAANFPFPYKSLYSASKVFVRNFTIALREELKASNIHVSVLQPGAVPTNEIVKNQINSGGFLSRLSVTSAKDVADIAITATLNNKAIITPGLKNRISLLIFKLFPGFISQTLLGKQGRKMIANNLKEN